MSHATPIPPVPPISPKPPIAPGAPATPPPAPPAPPPSPSRLSLGLAAVTLVVIGCLLPPTLSWVAGKAQEPGEFHRQVATNTADIAAQASTLRQISVALASYSNASEAIASHVNTLVINADASASALARHTNQLNAHGKSINTLTAQTAVNTTDIAALKAITPIPPAPPAPTPTPTPEPTPGPVTVPLYAALVYSADTSDPGRQAIGTVIADHSLIPTLGALQVSWYARWTFASMEVDSTGIRPVVGTSGPPVLVIWDATGKFYDTTGVVVSRAKAALKPPATTAGVVAMFSGIRGK